jgi:hypothetical protein
MNKADEIKKLADRLEESYYADEGPHIDSEEASAELHAAIDAQQAKSERLRLALLDCASRAEKLKIDYGVCPGSLQAIRNAQCQTISDMAHIALGNIKGQPCN